MILDPGSFRARVLALVILEPLQTTNVLAARLRDVPGSNPRRVFVLALRTIRASRLRASYALAWLRRASMVRRVEAFTDSTTGGALRVGWEATALGRAVLRSMLAEVGPQSVGQELAARKLALDGRHPFAQEINGQRLEPEQVEP